MSALENRELEDTLSGISFLIYLYKSWALSHELATEIDNHIARVEGILYWLDNWYVARFKSEDVNEKVYYLTNEWKDKLDKCVNILNKEEKYYSFEELIDMIDEPNKSLCNKMYYDNKEIFDTAKWSSIKHQAWEWGYIDHITEIQNIAVREYNDSTSCRELEFSLSDALLVLFLHDLEKPWKYAWTDEQKQEVESYSDYKDFIKKKLTEYWFNLTEDHLNALKYIHWEWNDYDPKKRIQWPLWAFVHICDTKSARMWYEEPKQRGEW